MMSHPRHGVWHHPPFVATLGRHIEEVVRSQQNVESPGIGGVGMEYLALRVLVKDAETRALLGWKIHRPEVVGTLAISQLVLCERNPIIEVEVAFIRRHPREAPSHALLEGLDLWKGCARNRGKCRIALYEVGPHAVEMVGEKRTARTAFLPSRTEHEVIDNQLAATVEEISQQYFSVWAVEDVLLLDFLPWHLAALAAQLIAQPGELLLLRQQFLPCRQPIRLGHSFRAQFLSCCRSHRQFSFVPNSLLISWREMPSRPRRSIRRSRPHRLRSMPPPSPDMPDTYFAPQRELASARSRMPSSMCIQPRLTPSRWSSWIAPIAL